MNSYERDARGTARRRSDRAYAALLEIGIDESEAAETAHRVFEQEFRFELAEAYGDHGLLREDLEVLADCLQVEDEEC
jgi:hypothetical protein